MFRFNKLNEPFFVSTQADVYILDKEFITIKEAGSGIKEYLILMKSVFMNRWMLPSCHLLLFHL